MCKFSGVFFVLLIVQHTYAQTFDDHINKASTYYDAGNYAQAVQKYVDAFKLSDGNAGQYYDAACSSALAGDSARAISFLKLAANKGFYNIKHIKQDKDLISLHALSSWQSILSLIMANKNEYEKNFDKPLKEKLESIYVKDQMLRQLYQDAEKKFGSESDEMQYFWKLMAQQDSINEIEVLKILDKHGWVGRSMVGGQANMALWLVVQHAPVPLQEKYLPLMRESVKKGESSGNHLALLEDRVLMHNGKPQIYGSQIVSDEKTGKMKVYEIKDPEYVNKRRKEVGLGPIEDYVKRWGIEWIIKQK